MTEVTVKLPDVGEGVAQAELVEWHVEIGDLIREDDILAAVMTDKATVEIPSPCDGRVIWLGGAVGDTLAVGAALVRLGDVSTIQTPAAGQIGEPSTNVDDKHTSEPPARVLVGATKTLSEPERAPEPVDTSRTGVSIASRRPLAAPSVRQRARESGVDLRLVTGSGPSGRISHADVERYATRTEVPLLPTDHTEVRETKIVGLRKKIAERMALSNARIPHITIVEEVDVSALEELRASLNHQAKSDVRLTLLPFLMRAMVRALAEQPNLNALFDDDTGVVRQHAPIHMGIATQTPNGLVVPVVRYVERRDVWECALEVDRLARSARDGSATRNELTGSTITITSLGALGAIATTPIINYPEVAIVGVNRMSVRPLWNGSAFVPRKVMNLSSSFDHRVVDGWDAAVFVQRLKALLEAPALIFMPA